VIKALKKLFSHRESNSGRKVIARFDAASSGGENARHWLNADYLSADAEANADVRRTLRTRARYEVANNTYAKGMLLTLANDTIGTGPRIQMLSGNDKLNSELERAFMRWAVEIDLAAKLRTVRMARCQDGEAFILLANNPKLSGKVKLDLQLIEADRVTDDSFKTSSETIDGIKFDSFGNPVSYKILRNHPGGDEFTADRAAYSLVPAEYVIHYFRIDRPGLHRGIPEITPALPLFAQLRRFTLAVLSAAEAAADFAGIIYTDSPANGEADELAPLDAVQLQRNMLLTMPGGWKMGQLDPKQPCSTYAEFKNQILNEIARCLNMPFNIACGNSSGYNYASGRLDHQTYYKAIRVERANIASGILDRIFALWLREYALVSGRKVSAGVDHIWFWDGFEHVDPAKEANATDIRLKNGTTTYSAEFARQGKDWEREMTQIAKERQRMAALGITFSDLTQSNQNQGEADDE
jgi:lambda family phage portal protein